MIGSRQDIARLQSDFYRDQFHRMLRWLTVSVVVIFILIFCVIYMVLIQPKIHFYGNSTDGTIMPMPTVYLSS